MSIEQFVVLHEGKIRLAFFVGVFMLVAMWELLAPRRALAISKSLRWSSNLALTGVNTLLLRFILPISAVGLAAFCAAHGWGVLNYFQLPLWLDIALTVIVMDFVIWLQHVVFHAVPALWSLHRVHHADLDYDLTTGSRFHPVEIMLSMLIKFSTIIVIGPPVVAVVVFEVILNVAAVFNHGNISLPAQFDRVLRWIIVTPDMHRVHHSVEPSETNSNFGFNLPWWDRLLGTYRDQPRAGHVGMSIGIHGHTNPCEVARLDGLLLMPFRRRSKTTPPKMSL